ncbi:hypothetical protein C8R44DRAFT_808716 [Mycena epipterygia]|nr:hypothetical protein C8R44DRAFT_808716 [Mycena epipterygia]
MGAAVGRREYRLGPRAASCVAHPHVVLRERPLAPRWVDFRAEPSVPYTLRRHGGRESLPD